MCDFVQCVICSILELYCIYQLGTPVLRLFLPGARKCPSLTEAIVEFNNNGLDESIKEAFQMSLLRLVLVTIMLEDQISHSVGNFPSELPAGSSTEWDRVRTSVQFSLTKVR